MIYLCIVIQHKRVQKWLSRLKAVMHIPSKAKVVTSILTHN